MSGKRKTQQTFGRKRLPPNVPVQWVDAVNEGIVHFRARKVAQIKYDGDTHFNFVGRWIDIYLQAHIRRALSLIDGGLAELKAGRTIVAAFCSRALIEDAASVWTFIRQVNDLLDEGNDTKLDDFTFSRAFSSRLPHIIEKWGDEHKATNILTAIDRMTCELPNVRPMYDELSDVCHPNTHGVLQHFADLGTSGLVTFDDGANMADIALGALIFSSLIFVGEEPSISRLEARLDILCGYADPTF